MKKSLPFIGVILLLLSLITGCSKDDRPAEELILGKWNDNKVEVVYYFSDGVIDRSETQYFRKGDLILDFLQDGTVDLYSGHVMVYSFAWEFRGEELYWNDEKLKYSVNENSLVLYFEFPEGALLSDGTYGSFTETHNATRE